MTFAAEYYVQIKKLHAMDRCLAVIAVTNEPPEVETFLKIE